mmetsp:Transcript_31243/g.27606  ORF Transcript_31243/g.27606 Transcript_31243/m.27606 type:complete len:165 (+) Transcript_31243:16-510(+)
MTEKAIIIRQDLDFKGSKDENEIKHDYLCSICLEIMLNAIKLPCGHRYCSNCLKSYSKIKKSLKCCLCRYKVKKEEKISNDKDFTKQLIKLYPKEYMKRDIEINGKKAMKKISSSKFHLNISYSSKLIHPGFMKGGKKSLPTYGWGLNISAPGLDDEKLKTVID